MKKTATYLAIRLSILCGFIVLVALFYEFALYPATLRSEGWLKELGERRFSKRADVLYFSASPNASAAPSDTDTRSISDMVQDQLKGYSIAAFDTGAVHAGIFLHALQQLPEGYTPKLVVMDFNLRSFGPQWIHSNLENSLQRNLVYWNHRPGLINRMNVVLKNYPSILDHERREIIYYDEKFADLPFGGSHRTIRLWADSLSARNPNGEGHSMIVHFGFRIRKNNVMLRYYDEVVSYCRTHDIPLLLMILPENIQGMENNAGSDLGSLCRQNITFLKNHYARLGTPILDLSETLPPEVFFESFPTEHYTAEGRKFVAGEMARSIERYLTEKSWKSGKLSR